MFVTGMLIWKKMSEPLAGDRYTTHREVRISLDHDDAKTITNISCSAYTIGPRGGASYGLGPGYTPEEWREINELIAYIQAGLSDRTLRICSNVEKPWETVITCVPCQGEIKAENLRAHRQLAHSSK